MVNVGEDPWLRLNMTFRKVIHVRRRWPMTKPGWESTRPSETFFTSNADEDPMYRVREPKTESGSNETTEIQAWNYISRSILTVFVNFQISLRNISLRFHKRFTLYRSSPLKGTPLCILYPLILTVFLVVELFCHFLCMGVALLFDFLPFLDKPLTICDYFFLHFQD